MRFGPCAIDEAQGAILAHSLRLTGPPGGRVIKKGSVLSAADCADLRAAGHESVIAAVLEPGDVGEDGAARAMAEAVAGGGLRVSDAATGRCNLYALESGLLRVRVDAVNAANAVDEALTIATPPDYARLEAGQLAATAKVIPYAAARMALDTVCGHLRGGLVLHRFQAMRAALIVTQVDGQKDSIIAKGIGAVEARLSGLGSAAMPARILPHEADALRGGIDAAMADAPDLLLILGGSATSDRQDVAPAALEASGGVIERFGMPVDPGNLLVLGRIEATPAIILPGCARSPALNGADWVLERIVARLPVTARDIAGMGVGGLLKEMPGRPHPREKIKR